MNKIAVFALIAALGSMPLGSQVLAQQTGTSAPTAAQPAPAQGLLIDAGSLVGTTVRNPEGKDIGKVSQLMIDPKEGRVNHAVLDIGGTLGVGGRSVAIPWSALKLGQDQGKLIVSIEQGLLDQAPQVQKGAPAASPGTAPPPEKKQ